MKARLSMTTQAFLCAVLPMCLVLAASFYALNTVIRGRVRERMHQSLQRAEKIQSSTRADYVRSYSQLFAFLGENGRLETWVRLLRELPAHPSSRSRIQEILNMQLQELAEESESDFIELSDSLGNPLASCVRNEMGGVVPLNLFPRPSLQQGQTAFCLNCHTAIVSNLLNVAGTLHEVATMPISQGARILGYLTVGRKFGIRSMSNFTYAALVQGNRVLLTSFPPDRVREVEQQLLARCEGSIDGCGIEVGGEDYLMLAVDNTRLPGLYSIQSIDAAVSEFTRGFNWFFFLIGAGGMLLVLLLSALSSRSLVKPIKGLIAQLKESERTGQFQSDFPTNSSAKEANLLAEAFNRAAEAVRRSHLELQALTGRLITTKEEESRRLARELHDVLSQKLAVLGMEVAALQQPSVARSPSLSEKLRLLGEDIGRLGRDVHQLSRQLHPSILDDLGLSAALRAECGTFSKQHGIPATFLPHNVPESLPTSISLSLYRIAQESLWNVAKHAGAREVRVILAGAGEEIVLAVQDDGRGFDQEQIKGKGGLGLVSMEERVRLVNGTLSVTSASGKGTQVEARIPLGGS